MFLAINLVECSIFSKNPTSCRRVPATFNGGVNGSIQLPHNALWFCEIFSYIEGVMKKLSDFPANSPSSPAKY